MNFGYSLIACCTLVLCQDLVLIARWNRRGETYFAKFTFITNGTEVEINPFGVVVRSVSTKQILVSLGQEM